MNKERVALTKEQALDCLIVKEGQVHNFIPAPFGIVGADWNLNEVKECLDKANSIEIGGEQCRKLNHGVAVISGEDVYFFEADNNKLDKYDIVEKI